MELIHIKRDEEKYIALQTKESIRLDKAIRKQQRRTVREAYKTKRRRHWIAKYKEAKGCSQCGYKKSHRAICFASNEIGQMKNYIRYGLKTMMMLIRSTDLICRNCINESANYADQPDNHTAH
tara:strand:+ start:1417 stop:1785 length:369 start_codon:yes stop_codon:yes gene_type:complete